MRLFNQQCQIKLKYNGSLILFYFLVQRLPYLKTEMSTQKQPQILIIFVYYNMYSMSRISIVYTRFFHQLALIN